MLADQMDEFICVRLIRTENLDLSVFQFDPDLTFAVFFLNADSTIYGRYGSRSDLREAEREMSLEGLRKALTAALGLHREYPGNAQALRAKTGPEPKFKVLTEYPWIRQRRRKTGDCLHCHHLQNAEQTLYRTRRLPIPEHVLFPWPMPDILGMHMDPQEKAKIHSVAEGSAAAEAGFKAGDEIRTLQGQPILSTADVQWVLHNAGRTETLRVEVWRGGKARKLTLQLSKDWRSRSDISWRATTGMLRLLGLGKMRLDDLSPTERRRVGLDESKLALRTRLVRQGSPAFAAGFRTGDILVAIDGMTHHMFETAVLAHNLRNKTPGEQVPVTVLRMDRHVDLKLSIQ
jgi:hypothetical protein